MRDAVARPAAMPSDPLPLDWLAPTIAGPRWHDLPMLASAAVGWTGIVIAALCALVAL